MNKKPVDKPLTEGNFQKVFQRVFEPYALAIQKDLSGLKSDVSELKADVSELKDRTEMFEDGQQRIEQRQIAEIKRKDFFSTTLSNHEKRIINLEKKSA